MTSIQVALLRKLRAQESWAAVAWDIKQQQGVDVTEDQLEAWANGSSVPDGTIHQVDGKWQPTERSYISEYLQLQDRHWWNEHEGAVRARKRKRKLAKAHTFDDPFDTRAYGAPGELP